MRILNRIFLLLTVGLLVMPFDSVAQCAMCKAVAESSTETGSTVATGLNAGILYLMIFPYLIIGAVSYAIYRHRKAQRASLESED